MPFHIRRNKVFLSLLLFAILFSLLSKTSIKHSAPKIIPIKNVIT